MNIVTNVMQQPNLKTVMSDHTEILDPVEEMLKKTGCIELHYKVQVRLIILYVSYFTVFRF